jgi:L-cystine uptake protein TcyP (sodium:dicarboxylate symporter family)
MQINGIEIDYNLYDTTQFKKFELGLINVKKEIDELPNRELMQYEKAEICCKLICDLILDLFGEDKFNEIIPNKNDMMLCVMVFAELMEISKEWVKTSNQKLEKYTLKRINGKHINR